MGRFKNALRGHFVQPYVEGEESASEAWLLLAKYIQTVDPDNDETTEEQAWYDGDGTAERDVTGVAIGYNFSGHRDKEDAAQNLIADMEFETGSNRKVWFRRVSADGSAEHVGKATVSGIVTDGGDAADYEQFECNIRWDQKPEKVETPAG